jgi:UrcA family protein
MKTLASLAAVLTLAPLIALGGAASAREARIAWGDLDLSTAAGAEAFDTRVRAAARGMCRNAPMIGGRADCRAAVRDEAFSLLPGAARADYARGRAPLVA